MDPVLDVTLRTGFGLLFGAAAAHKLGDLPRFQATLVEYRLVPAPAVGLASLALVGGELLLVLGLLLPATRAVALGGAAGLLAIYGIAIAVNLLRGRSDLDCGCLATSGRRTISWWLVVRNVTLVAVALGARAPIEVRSLGWVDAVTVTGALATTVLSWVAMDGLLANLPGIGRIRGTA